MRVSYNLGQNHLGHPLPRSMLAKGVLFKGYIHSYIVTLEMGEVFHVILLPTIQYYICNSRQSVPTFFQTLYVLPNPRIRLCIPKMTKDHYTPHQSSLVADTNQTKS